LRHSVVSVTAVTVNSFVVVTVTAETPNAVSAAVLVTAVTEKVVSIGLCIRQKTFTFVQFFDDFETQW